jgi:hypothetical protein
MAVPNVRGAYELLRWAMQQHALQQQGEGFCPLPNSALGYNSDGVESPQGGLLGGLLALEGKQSPYQPPAVNDQAAPARSLDPNFRQLSRMPSANRTQGTNAAPAQSSVRPNPTFSVGENAPLDSPSTTTVPALPPPIPMSAVPEWLKTFGNVMNFDPTNWSDDDYARCLKAAGGSTEDWEEFCRSLPRRQNNTSGGESQNKACWSKTFESPANKKNWCANQFGNN